MKVLIACEFSGIVRGAFARQGHDAWSCDLLPTEMKGNHIRGDVLQVLDNGWDLMIAHPDCTFLANSGVRWLVDNPDRYNKMVDACMFFDALLHAPVRAIAIENPIHHKYAKSFLRKYDQIIQPWQFGHPETKATCLWLKGLPLLKPTNIVEGRKPRVHYESPGKDRWKRRSRTYQGIADAMAEQWGKL